MLISAIVRSMQNVLVWVFFFYAFHMLCLLESKVQSWSSLGQGWVRKMVVEKDGPKTVIFFQEEFGTGHAPTDGKKKHLLCLEAEMIGKCCCKQLAYRYEW